MLRTDGIVAAEGVDIQASPSGEVQSDNQLIRLALQHDVPEHQFYTFFMVSLVIAKGADIAKEGGQIDMPATVVKHQCGPVRLSGNRAIGSEKVAI